MKSLTQFHDFTSYRRDRMGGHFLDWKNQPSVYKTYPNTEIVQLPKDIRFPRKFLSNLLRESEPDKRPLRLDMEDVSRILLLTYSLTAKTLQGDAAFYYRSVASAGALYPTEIYVATRDVSGLDDGLYHFDIARHGLTALQKGYLSADDPTPSLMFLLSAIFFRSAWKYRDRSYRYHLLDTGHLIENLILSLKALHLPAFLSYDFDDTETNHFLGLDETKEVCLALCGVSRVGSLPPLPPVVRSASPVALKQIDYPAVREIHTAGYKVGTIAGEEGVCNLGVTPDKWTKILRPQRWPEITNYTGAIFERRSRRNFVKDAVPNDYVSALLECLITPDSRGPESRSSRGHTICTGVLMERCDGFKSGFYMAEMDADSVGLVAAGSFMDKMAHICLDQTWLANSALHFFFLANLHAMDRVWGPRGYRYAMMAAGRMGERLYLAATALGLGCCGIGAFYDSEGATFLDLNRESRLLYLVAVGPVKTKARK